MTRSSGSPVADQPAADGEDLETAQQVSEAYHLMMQQMARSIIGQEDVTGLLLVAWLLGRPKG